MAKTNTNATATANNEVKAAPKKRHSATYNSIRKALRAKYPDMSEKALNIKTIYACRKHDAEAKARREAKAAAVAQA